MAKSLVIVESPTKAKTITKFLGKNYKVLSTMGHIRDLPKSKLGVDIENDFAPQYIPIRGKGDVIKKLKQEAKESKKIYLASDPDREGEAIAWHLQQLLGVADKEFCRVEFHEITKQAITQAVKNPRAIDIDRVNAQQARRILDRLVGYKLSPLLWKKIKKGLSAGRVQSVTVRLICDREKEIDAFIPEEYWTVSGTFLTPQKEKFNAKLLKKDKKNVTISSEEDMETINAELKNNPYTVTKVTLKEKKKSPSPPFTTSTLQQEAVRKLNFTAKKTMMLAQQLYEGVELGPEGAVGLITYMRTDSVNISETAKDEAKAFIIDTYGKEYVMSKARNYTTKGKAQNAHEAIRPTSVARTPDNIKQFLSRDQLRLYKLIWERFLASQMAEAVFDTTTADIEGFGYLFRASGSKIKFLGYKTLYEEGTDEENKEKEDGNLPVLEEKMLVELKETIPKQHFTQPPARYSEASLVKTLEELGIGRPSTYAPTIDTILTRGYVVKIEKQFRPTELGYVVIDLLKEHFPEIIDIKFTAQMEEDLDEIAEGLDWHKTIKEFYEVFAKQLAEAEEKISKIKIEDEVSDVQCEKCGRMMVYKMGRYGKFLACPGFPECRNVKPIIKEIGVSCPTCKGSVVERKGKRGKVFFGCSNYPECTYTSWDKPSQKDCPHCNTRLVEKFNRKKEPYLLCPNKECKYEEKIEVKSDQG